MVFQPGNDLGQKFQPGESGNPAGKPKGALHLSTHIQNMLNDPEFEMYLEDKVAGFKLFKGAPINAIVKTATIKAAAGEKESREWLAKYGYGQKFEIEHSGEIETGIADPLMASKFLEYLKNDITEKS